MDRAIASAKEWTLAQGSNPVTRTSEGHELVANRILLHMIADSADMSQDQDLRKFVDKIMSATWDPAWDWQVDPSRRFERPSDTDLNSLAEYQRWMLLAASSDSGILREDEKADVMATDKYRTGRATHQLIALYLLRKHKGGTPSLEHIIDILAHRIASEAAVDFRVTDLYLQRLALLFAVDRAQLVKPRWVERALGAQGSDGAWLPSWYGWGPSPFQLQFRFRNGAIAHSTAQGLWLVNQVRYRQSAWIESNYSTTR